MLLDVTQFGYGAGLVMVGFIAGVVVNACVQVLRSVR